MRAVVITRPGGPEVLELREVPDPTFGPDEVLVRVHAAGLNRADLLQRQGRYPAPPGAPADIPGLEFAGEVAKIGERVREWTPGQRVFGLLGGGGYAEYCIAHERAVAEVPPNLNWAEAAAVPESFITAHDAMIVQCGLRSGEKVLIHAAASGVGLAAAQLARAGGATAYGTTRSAEKTQRAQQHGYTAAARLASPADLPAQTREWLGSGGFDVIVDLVGGPYVAASIDVAAPRARIVLVGSVAGRKLELDQGKIMSKRLTITGTVLRARPLEEKIAATQAFARQVVPLLASGAVKPVIDSDYALADVQKAHARLESNETFGKVVLRID
jgi:putative PIG3 family NAD(P)H quinone oxidoreductase